MSKVHVAKATYYCSLPPTSRSKFQTTEFPVMYMYIHVCGTPGRNHYSVAYFDHVTAFEAL